MPRHPFLREENRRFCHADRLFLPVADGERPPAQVTSLVLDQQVQDWVIRVMFLGEAEMQSGQELNLASVAWAFSTSDAIWDLWVYVFNSRNNPDVQQLMNGYTR